MSARKLLIIAGIASVAAVVAWFALREPSRSSNPERSGSASSDGPTPEPTRSIPEPTRPTRDVPERRSVPAGATDAEWSRITEEELRARLAELEPTSITCTAPTCEIVIEARDEAALTEALAQLDELSDFAENIVIDAPATTEAGRRITVTAHFAR